MQQCIALKLMDLYSAYTLTCTHEADCCWSCAALVSQQPLCCKHKALLNSFSVCLTLGTRAASLTKTTASLATQKQTIALQFLESVEIIKVCLAAFLPVYKRWQVHVVLIRTVHACRQRATCSNLLFHALSKGPPVVHLHQCLGDRMASVPEKFHKP